MQVTGGGHAPGFPGQDGPEIRVWSQQLRTPHTRPGVTLLHRPHRPLRQAGLRLLLCNCGCDGGQWTERAGEGGIQGSEAPPSDGQ